jgi:YVTN family beta-propeller protein
MVPVLLGLLVFLLLVLAGGAAAQPTIIAIIPQCCRVGPIAANPATNRVYAAQEDPPVVAVIDGSTNTIVATVPTAGYHTGIDVDPVTKRIYVSQQWAQAVRIIDGATNSVITDLHVPGGWQAGDVSINPATGRLYVVRAGAGYGDVAVFDAATYTLLATVGGWGQSLYLAVNPETNRIYVAEAWNDSVHVIDGASNSVLPTVPVGDSPGLIGVNPATNRIYVPNGGSGTISVIDGVSNTVVDVFAVGGTPVVVGVNPVTNRLYVSDFYNDRVLVRDGATGDLLATLAVPAYPGDVAVIPSTSRIYVASDAGRAVTVIEDLSDTTPPAITLTTPAEGAIYTLKQVVWADYACEDEPGGSGLASCVGDVADGAAIDTASVGAKTFTVTAEDNARNIASATHAYSVVYSFSGFFSPVDNPPVLNSVKAGSGVPVKFSLGGDQSVSIFATGYPKSQKITCDTSAPLDTIEETVTAGSSSLSYDPIADQYVYVWKTDKAWANTCRQLVAKLNDGTEHVANFKFK